MTWNISFSAPSKAAAKVELTIAAANAMLPQRPHARDFDVVRNAISGAIDACEEGVISVMASGHVNTDWKEPMPSITAVNMTMSVFTTEA